MRDERRVDDFKTRLEKVHFPDVTTRGRTDTTCSQSTGQRVGAPAKLALVSIEFAFKIVIYVDYGLDC